MVLLLLLVVVVLVDGVASCACYEAGEWTWFNAAALASVATGVKRV